MGSVTQGAQPVLAGADRAGALAAVKAQLRVEAAADEALILAFAETALGIAEAFTGQVLIARELVAAMPPAASWQRLPAAPVRSIAPVAGDVDIDADGAGWVRVAGGAAVTFTAGAASGWNALPAPLRQGAAMLAAHLFDDVSGRGAPPAAVTALWRPFRAARLIEGVRA